MAGSLSSASAEAGDGVNYTIVNSGLLALVDSGTYSCGVITLVG